MAKTFDLSVIFKVIDKATRPIRKIGNSLKKLSGPIKKASRSFKELGKTLGRVGKKMTDVGKSMALKLTAPLVLMAGLATRSAIKFESAFTGVRKTVDATKEQFAVLKKQLMDLALVIPVATTELFGIAEAAGQLDIKRPNIPGFTKTIAALGIAAPVLEMQEAAIQLAQFAKVTQMSQKDFDRLASTLVYLGNNTATTEDKILNMSMRLASAGSTIGLTQAEIFGLGAALAQLGLEAEAGGSAFSRVMRQMSKEIALGSNKVQGFATVSGQNVTDFKKAWEKDSLGAVIKFVEGLGKLEGRGKSVEVVLNKLGMDALRISDSLIRAAKAGDEFRETIKEGSKEWKRNTALTEELNKRLEDTKAQLIMAKNRAEQMAVSFGNALLPVILKVVKFLEPLVDWLTKLSPTTKVIIIAIAALVAVIGPLLIVFGFVASAISAIIAIGAPAVVIIAAISAAFIGLGAVFIQVIRHWEDLKWHFNNMGWKDWLKFIYDIGKAMIKFILNPIRSVFNIFKKLKGWVSGGIKTSTQSPLGETGTQNPLGEIGRNPISGMSESKSQTDINIKLTADQGTSATIEKVKSKGNTKPNIATVGYIGATF